MLLRGRIQNDDRQRLARQFHVSDRHGRRRLESIEHGGDLTPRLVGDLLADDSSIRGDPENHTTTQAVEERAEGLAGTPELRRRSFEFEGLGLAPGDESLQLVHPDLSDRASRLAPAGEAMPESIVARHRDADATTARQQSSGS